MYKCAFSPYNSSFLFSTYNPYCNYCNQDRLKHGDLIDQNGVYFYSKLCCVNTQLIHTQSSSAAKQQYLMRKRFIYSQV